MFSPAFSSLRYTIATIAVFLGCLTLTRPAQCQGQNPGTSPDLTVEFFPQANPAGATPAGATYGRNTYVGSNNYTLHFSADGHNKVNVSRLDWYVAQHVFYPINDYIVQNNGNPKYTVNSVSGNDKFLQDTRTLVNQATGAYAWKGIATDANNLIDDTGWYGDYSS